MLVPESGNGRTSATRLVRFGVFDVDLRSGELRKQGVRIKLQEQPFQVLAALLEKPGEVVTREELRQRLWPHDTFGDFDNGLNKAINKIREALGDSADTARFVETLARRGYRFIAPIAESKEKVEVEPLALHLVAIPKEGARPALVGAIPVRRYSWALPLLGVLLILSGVLARWLRSPPSVPPQRALWRLTFEPGLQSGPTWSPDGRFIAYSSDRGGNFDLWVQPVGGGDPVRVTRSSAHDWQPGWSPDGSNLVFRSERDGGGLYVVPVLGGHERRISPFGYRPLWSPDGSQILFLGSDTQFAPGFAELPKVFVASLDGLAPRQILADNPTELSGVISLSWHPDGRRISICGSDRSGKCNFYTSALDGGALVKSELADEVKKRFKESSLMVRRFRWAASGRTLYIEGLSRDVRNLWKVTVDPQTLRWTGGPERLTTGLGLETDIAVSSDGRRLAFCSRLENTRLWSVPFDPRSGSLRGQERPLTAAGILATVPSLSADDMTLVYETRVREKDEIRVISIADGRETVLATSEVFLEAPAVSPDGSRVAYERGGWADREHTRYARSLIWKATAGGDEHVLTSGQAYVPSDWSADGRWILASQSAPTQMTFRLVLYPLSAAPRAETEMRVIASDPEYGLFQGHLSPDGRWICFNAVKLLEGGNSSLHVVPASGGKWTRITNTGFWDDKPRWSPDGQTIYFLSNRSAGFLNVWGIRFDPTQGKPVGAPFQVTRYESPGRMVLPLMQFVDIPLNRNRLVLPITEVTGSIWVLEGVDR